MSDACSSTPDVRRLAEASAWRVALFDADLETSMEFEAWLDSAPENLSAWRQVCQSWDRFPAGALEPELIVARRDALERARQRKAKSYASGRRHLGRLRVAAGLAAAAFVGVVAALGVGFADRADVYSTAPGERRTITLADGSHVELDSSSLLKVRLRPRARALELLRGQADFQVAHDLDRPFTVSAGGKTVVATGTNFDVDLFEGQVIVTLIEGRVSVLQSRPRSLSLAIPSRPEKLVARLSPGEQLLAPAPSDVSPNPPAPPVVLRKVNALNAVTWQAGELVFDNEPLATAAARVARYGDEPIEVEPSAAGLRLSGVFMVGDVPTFLDAIQRELPVTAETDADRIVRLRRNGA